MVECTARVDQDGVHPLPPAALPEAALATISEHVARQELIVEAALSGRKEAALEALAADPLVANPADAAPMLEGLIEANAIYLSPDRIGTACQDRSSPKY